jgi:hypothetical protein
MAAFTEERLHLIRRLRKARRLWKRWPLMALSWMQADYPGYTASDLQEDLRRRTKKKKRFVKSPLKRYGRYNKFQQLMDLYEESKDPVHYLAAMRIRRTITKPYRMLFSIKGQKEEYSLDPLIPYGHIEQLASEGKKCNSLTELEELITKFKETHSVKN